MACGPSGKEKQRKTKASSTRCQKNTQLVTSHPWVQILHVSLTHWLAVSRQFANPVCALGSAPKHKLVTPLPRFSGAGLYCGPFLVGLFRSLPLELKERPQALSLICPVSPGAQVAWLEN